MIEQYIHIVVHQGDKELEKNVATRDIGQSIFSWQYLFAFDS